MDTFLGYRFKMQYLNGFNGSTPLEAVVGEHHKRVSAMMADLGIPVDEAADTGSLEVPGVDLAADWDTRPMEGRDSLFIARMKAMVEGGSVNLLAFTVVKPDFGTPVRVVEGFRGGGDDLYGDYRMGTLRVGLVEYSLGRLGVNGEPVDEPFGTTKHQLPRLLANLDATELERLRVVDQGIRDGFDAVEMIRGGEPAADVLDMMGMSRAL